MPTEKGYPHFFYLASMRFDGKDAAPRRIPCTCKIGQNHWVKNPLSKKEGVVS